MQPIGGVWVGGMPCRFATVPQRPAAVRGSCRSSTLSSPSGRRRLPLANPGRYGLVAAPAGVVPGAPEHVPVLAQGALVVRLRPPVPEPDGQGVPFELVGVVERVAGVGVAAALHVRAGLLSQRPPVADALDTRGLLPEVDVLDKEEAALHPLVGDRPLRIPREL